MKVKLYFKPSSYGLAKEFMSKLNDLEFNFTEDSDEKGFYIIVDKKDELNIRKMAEKYKVELY
ncbi:MAG: hypothetical protein ACLFUI_11200 [Halanaerobiales bacterium]